MSAFSFNAGQHNPSTAFDVLPAGWYVAQVVKSEIKPTSKPGGARLNLQFQILNAPAAGRVVFGGYNIKNDNPVAVEIAMNELAALSNAINTPVWNQTEELHGKPFHLKIKIVKDSTGQYEDKNEPNGYKKVSEPVKLIDSLATGPAPAGQAFGAPAQSVPAGGFGAPGVAPAANQGFGAPAAGAPSNAAQQPQQAAPAVNQQPWAQQPQQQVQQPAQEQAAPVQQNQQPAAQPAGQQDFAAAAASQPWSQPAQQQQQAAPVEQQQQAAAQPVAEQQAAPQTEQATAQQPAWAQNTVQPGSEQPAQQQQAAAQQQAPQDAVAEAAQAAVPPWARQPQ